MGIKERWQKDLARGVDPQAIPSGPAVDFYRVNVWTGPVAVREVAARVGNMRGMLRCGLVCCGTEKIWFDLHASCQEDALTQAADILRYQGLAPLATGAGFTARKVS